MAKIERLTITLPSDIAAVVKGAVADGAYASTSQVVRAALRDWQMKSRPTASGACGAQSRLRQGAGRCRSRPCDGVRRGAGH